MIRMLLIVSSAVLAASGAAARPAVPLCDNIDVMRPCAWQPNFLAGVTRIRVTLKRLAPKRTAVARRHKVAHAPAAPAPQRVIAAVQTAPAAAPSASAAQPQRYIAGRLVCALNVNAALAERGIRGTGSALAKSFLRWGQASPPVPGAVAVSSRRGGGHVAIVKEVRGDGTVIVWNPSPRGRGWQQQVYRHRAIGFRVAG